MCQINTLNTFRWRHLLVKPEKTYAYTWYAVMFNRVHLKTRHERNNIKLLLLVDASGDTKVIIDNNILLSISINNL